MVSDGGNGCSRLLLFRMERGSAPADRSLDRGAKLEERPWSCRWTCRSILCSARIYTVMHYRRSFSLASTFATFLTFASRGRTGRYWYDREILVSFLFRFLGRYVLAFFHLTVVLIEHQTGSWIWLFIEDPLFKKRIYFITLIARNPWTKFRSTEKFQSNVISELLRTWDEMAQQRFRQRKIRMWTGYGSPMSNNNEKKKKYEKEKKK